MSESQTGTARRMLISDWSPPGSARPQGLPQAADDRPPQARPHLNGGQAWLEGGVAYQRCGGGVRVLRKRIGHS